MNSLSLWRHLILDLYCQIPAKLSWLATSIQAWEVSTEWSTDASPKPGKIFSPALSLSLSPFNEVNFTTIILGYPAQVLAFRLCCL